jgi:hypothetical protein
VYKIRRQPSRFFGLGRPLQRYILFEKRLGTTTLGLTAGKSTRNPPFWIAVARLQSSTTHHTEPSHWTESIPNHSSSIVAFFTVVLADAPLRFAPRLPLQQESESFSKRRLTVTLGDSSNTLGFSNGATQLQPDAAWFLARD